MFAFPFFALTQQQLKTENNKLNIYTQYLMKSTFETIWLFVHRPVGLVELLILYARVQFYTPRASDYRLISKTVMRIEWKNPIFILFWKKWQHWKWAQENIQYSELSGKNANIHNRLKKMSIFRMDWKIANIQNCLEKMSLFRMVWKKCQYS